MAKVTITRFIHLHLKEVPEYYRATPEKAVETITLSSNESEHWNERWKGWGILLHVEEVEITFELPDPVKVEVDHLKQEIANIQAEAEVKIKKCRDRINDLQLIGYDAGSAKVVEVEDAVVKSETKDDGFPS